jgi:beta-lactamase regulating signal transducer with metallopeptidase domain
MTSFVDPAASIVSIAFWITVKASVVLLLAAIGQVLIYRRASATTRHLVWTLAIISVLLVPLLSVVLPAWPAMVRSVAATAADPAASSDRLQGPAAQALPSAPLASGELTPPGMATVEIGSATLAQAVSWPAAIGGVYAAGLLVMLTYLAIQRRSVRRLAGEATVVEDGDWTRLLRESAASLGIARPVRLLRSRERSMPMAFGSRRPAILIPAVADLWPADRRRAVILHELAHVARYDCLTQSLAFAACTVYWFHPAAWWVARRLRIERELACDDRVIAAGAGPREYAGHLLEIAYAFGSHRAPAFVVSMARRRQLEGRMLAVLDTARNRNVPALRARIAAAAFAVLLLIPLASATVTVAAADPDGDRQAATAAPATPAQGNQQPAPHLKALWDAPFRSVHRLVRAAAAAIGIPQDGLPGTWEIRPTGSDGTVHLRLVELNSSSGSNVPIEQLEGLTAAQRGAAGGPVQFRIRRDAGTFTFEGVFRSGVGAGTYSFTPDPNFAAELAKRGLARPTAREQYQLARHDVGFAFLDELTKQGYAKPQTADLVRAGQHGVHAEYLREMGELGYRLGSLNPLIELRDHGVTPGYVRELAAQGYKGLPAGELRRARDHGVDPEYVRTMRDAGYGSLTMEQLVNARDHGVDGRFVRELSDAGHRKLPLDEIIRVRDHGVTPEYVREMRQLGHAPTINELVRVRDHGVTPDFVRRMAALGYDKLPIDALVRARDHGVTPAYIEELKALGYDRLAIDDVVMLRDHGLTTDRIRSANARAGTRLPIDMLRSFAAGGMR